MRTRRRAKCVAITCVDTRAGTFFHQQDKTMSEKQENSGCSEEQTVIQEKELLLESRVRALTGILIKIAEKSPGYVVRKLVEEIGIGSLESWTSAVACTYTPAQKCQPVAPETAAPPQSVPPVVDTATVHESTSHRQRWLSIAKMLTKDPVEFDCADGTTHTGVVPNALTIKIAEKLQEVFESELAEEKKGTNS